jgi:hypothetical protein
MGSGTSKTFVFDPMDYADLKKDAGISLENYVLRMMANEYDISKVSGLLKKPTDTICTLIRAIHQNQDAVKPISFEVFEAKGEILARLKKFPA